MREGAAGGQGADKEELAGSEVPDDDDVVRDHLGVVRRKGGVEPLSDGSLVHRAGIAVDEERSFGEESEDGENPGVATGGDRRGERSWN